jgi:ribosomal protein S18 acetylase RimI-like enzyme
MEIRKLTAVGYNEIVKFWSIAHLPHKPRGRDSEQAIALEMKANPDFFLGAFEQGRLVGTVVISCDLRKGWINRLAVHPALRTRGIARAPIDESERILRQRGVRLICVLIEGSNVASKSLFRKCGYEEHHDILYFSKRDSRDA